MIKRIELASRRVGVALGDFSGAWGELLRSHAGAPEDARPIRIVLCVALDEPEDAPRHDGVSMEWFSDADHVERFEAWSSAHASDLTHDALAEGVAGHVVVAREVVLRGAAWLEARWGAGGPVFKHMAVARRAPHLSPEEFSRQWQSRAGVVVRPGDAAPVDIPAVARGQAYVQNHPLPRANGEWAYDAVNEVYFDDREGLQRRIEWFAASLGDGRAETDLVGDRAFLSTREDVLFDAGSPRHERGAPVGRRP